MAVGDGQCVCTGHGAWSSVVRSLLCGHLWLLVFMGIIVCGRCGQLLPFAVWAVVVGHRVS